MEIKNQKEITIFTKFPYIIRKDKAKTDKIILYLSVSRYNLNATSSNKGISTIIFHKLKVLISVFVFLICCITDS